MWSAVEVEVVIEVDEMTDEEVVLVIEEEVDHVTVGIEDVEAEVVTEEVEAEVQEDEALLILEELNRLRKRKKLAMTIMKKDIALP